MPTYYGGLSNGYELRLHITQTSRDENANTSEVAWSLELVKTGSFTIRSGYQNPWSVNVAGNVRSGSKSYNFGSYTNLLLGQGTVTVPHESDGTKVIAFNASYNDIAGLIADGSVPTSFLALTPNPRGSRARLTNPTTGASQTHTPAGSQVRINTDRSSSSFTHTIRYGMGSASGVIATGVTDFTVWTVPLSLLNQFPNGPTGYGYIWVDTYNGGTLIQTRDTPFAVTVPASIVPTIGSITHAEATAGLPANVGAYVKGLSKLTVSVTGEAGIYGSTIKERKVEIAGQVLIGDPVTTDVINASGTVPLKVTVTDSRGQKAVSTTNLTILNYAPPKINEVTVQRALSSGSPSEDGSYLRININASASSLIVGGTQRNKLRYVVHVKPHGQASWGTPKVDTTVPGGGVAYNAYVLTSPYLSNMAYEVKVTIYDDFGNVTAERVVPTALIAMHFDGNEGVGIGKYRENGMLDVLGQIFANDSRPVPFAFAMGAVENLTTVVQPNNKLTGSVVFPANPDGKARFTQAPLVLMTGENGRFIYAKNKVTTAGFDWSADNWSNAQGAPTGFDWLAFQMMPTSSTG